MIQRLTQVRNLAIGVFCCALLLSSNTALAAKTAQEQQKKALSTDAGNSDIDFSLSDLFPSESKKEDKPDKAEEKKLIHAKRIDATREGKDAPKKAAPYKVYTAPRIPEATNEPTQNMPSQPAFQGWGEVDPDQPPSLAAPSPIKESVPELPRDPNAPLQDKEIVRENLKPLVMPKVKSLPKQFFPILPLGEGGKKQAQLLPVASNIPLSADHTYTRRAIVSIHDISRNSAQSVAMLTTLSGIDGGQTLILSPQFPLAVDIMRFAKHLPDSGRQVARWSIDLGWEFGGPSHLSKKMRGISSFTAVDILLMFLSDRTRFPSLEKIVIAGHGMGGDFVQRYTAVGVGPSILKEIGIGYHFVAANPSSYLYLTGSRPLGESLRFGPADKSTCKAVNDYPYGLEKLSSYARRKGESSTRLDYPTHPIAYMVGDKFVVDHYLDRNCGASYQGKDRYDRALNFNRYLKRSFGNAHYPQQTFTVVPNVGYDPVSLYGSPCGMSVLFEDARCGE